MGVKFMNQIDCPDKATGRLLIFSIYSSSNTLKHQIFRTVFDRVYGLR